jgi:Uma2 family endonuclease
MQTPEKSQTEGWIALHIPPEISPQIEALQKANVYLSEYEPPLLWLKYQAYEGEEPVKNLCQEGWFALHIPEEMKLGEHNEAFWEANPEHRIEYYFNTLFVRYMAHKNKAGRFNSKMAQIFENWNDIEQLGMIYDADTGVLLDNGKWGEPDGCFVSFFTASLQEQMSWRTYIEQTPDLLWEVVSDQRNLEQEKYKMQHVWAEQEGFSCGLLIDPFGKDYWVYEKGRKYPSQYGFSTAFTHSSLPNLRIDFQAIYKKAFEMAKNQG